MPEEVLIKRNWKHLPFLGFDEGRLWVPFPSVSLEAQDHMVRQWSFDPDFAFSLSSLAIGFATSEPGFWFYSTAEEEAIEEASLNFFFFFFSVPTAYRNSQSRHWICATAELLGNSPDGNILPS